MRNLKLSINPKSWKLWMIIMVLIAGFLFFYITQLPAKGTVKTLLPSDVKESTNEEGSAEDKLRQQFVQKARKIEEKEAGREGYDTYRGKYISFQYPNSYDIRTNESSSSGILEKIILLDSGISLSKLTATVTEMANISSLDEISGVAARRLKPDTYQEKTFDISGNEGILFEKKKSGYEKTVFSLADQILITIALTSTNKDNNLDADFDFVLKELKLNR